MILPLDGKVSRLTMRSKPKIPLTRILRNYGRARDFTSLPARLSMLTVPYGPVRTACSAAQAAHYSYASTPLKSEIANLLAWSNLSNCSRTEQP
jgi:hypothetical protein